MPEGESRRYKNVPKGIFTIFLGATGRYQNVTREIFTIFEKGARRYGDFVAFNRLIGKITRKQFHGYKIRKGLAVLQVMNPTREHCQPLAISPYCNEDTY